MHRFFTCSCIFWKQRHCYTTAVRVHIATVVHTCETVWICTSVMVIASLSQSLSDLPPMLDALSFPGEIKVQKGFLIFWIFDLISNTCHTGQAVATSWVPTVFLLLSSYCVPATCRWVLYFDIHRNPLLGTSIPVFSGKTGPERLNDIARVVQLVCNKARISAKNLFSLSSFCRNICCFLERETKHFL